eukprot:gene21149-27760_t
MPPLLLLLVVAAAARAPRRAIVEPPQQQQPAGATGTDGVCAGGAAGATECAAAGGGGAAEVFRENGATVWRARVLSVDEADSVDGRRTWERQVLPIHQDHGTFATATVSLTGGRGYDGGAYTRHGVDVRGDGTRVSLNVWFQRAAAECGLRDDATLPFTVAARHWAGVDADGDGRVTVGEQLVETFDTNHDDRVDAAD